MYFRFGVRRYTDRFVAFLIDLEDEHMLTILGTRYPPSKAFDWERMRFVSGRSYFGLASWPGRMSDEDDIKNNSR